MKITKSQLKQIIREELENIVEGPDLANDGQSNAEEAYRIAFANYADELIKQKAKNVPTTGYVPSSVVKEIEDEVIDELADMMIGYVRSPDRRLDDLLGIRE